MTEKELTPFSKAVRKKMIDMDLNSKGLARLIGTSEKYLSQILCGDRPRSKYIKVIEDKLGLDPNEYTA